MEISPTYHYTRDGITPVTVADALRSGIKRMERNLAVKQTLTLISESIQRGQQADILRQEYPHLQFGHLLSFNVNQGIDDALWNKAKAKPVAKVEKDANGGITMNISILPEPELEFGHNARHIDIRHGITHLKPFDINDTRRPDKISVGIVGTSESIGGVSRWFNDISQAIPGKAESPNRYLFPQFSQAIEKDIAFSSEIVLDTSSNESINPKEIVACAAIKDYNKRITALVDVFLPGDQNAYPKKPVKVIVVAIPWQLIELLADAEISPQTSEEGRHCYSSVEEEAYQNANTADVKICIP